MQTVIRPTGRGLNNQLAHYGAVTAWQAVADVTPDEDVSYIYLSSFVGGTVEGADSFITNWDLRTGQISNVTITVRCRKMDSTVAVATSNTALRLSTTDRILGAEETLSSSYVDYETSYDLSPFSGTYWTQEELEDLQVGVHLKTDSSFEGAVRCTQVYAVVTWQPLRRTIAIPQGKKLTISNGSQMTLGTL